MPVNYYPGIIGGDGVHIDGVHIDGVNRGRIIPILWYSIIEISADSESGDTKLHLVAIAVVDPGRCGGGACDVAYGYVLGYWTGIKGGEYYGVAD